MIKISRPTVQGMRRMLRHVGAGVAAGSIFGGTVGALSPKDEGYTRGQQIRKSLIRGIAKGTAGGLAAMPFRGTVPKMIAGNVAGGAASAAMAYPRFKTKREEALNQQRKMRRLQRQVRRLRNQVGSN